MKTAIPAEQKSHFLHSLLALILSFFFHLSAHSQNCQGSFDQEDLYGESLIMDRPFMCGTGMMEERRFQEKMIREGKGFYDIEGLNFYGSNGYYKKNEKLYYIFHMDSFVVVPNSDIASLEIVGNFMRDKKNVYCNGKAQAVVNIETFEPLLDAPYAKDDSLVYFDAIRGGTSESDQIHIVVGANPKYFVTLCDEKLIGSCNYYGVDDKQVYFSGGLIPEADASSFELLEDGYARDSKFVYYGGVKLEGSSGRSFERLDYYYSRDKNNVYCYGEIVPGLNGNNFKLLGQGGMGTDGIGICYHTEVFANSDPATYVDLGCGYSKDANNVYFRGRILEHIDAASFEVLAWGFTKDENGVYCDEEIIPDANPDSFEVLGRKYARDKKHIFYLRTLLKECDRESFVADSDDPNKGGDEKATYFRGKRSLR